MTAAPRLKTEEQKATRTIVDTICVTPKIVEEWKSPPFQRPVKENQKVIDLAQEMKNDGGVWPGIVTLGVIKNGDTYIVDGQHRRAAFLLSGLKEGFTDVRLHYFENLSQAGEEFVRLNSYLAKMYPDDILRGLEMSVQALATIRKRCPFVGYDSIRRSDRTPIVSMSLTIKCWAASGKEIPSINGFPGGAAPLIRNMKDNELDHLCDYLALAISAFGREPQFYRLWGALNIGLTMWLYRRLVLGHNFTGNKRYAQFSADLFKKCCMSLSTEDSYLDWLVGRGLTDRDRSAAFNRVKNIFISRASAELGKKITMPQPDWVQ